MHRLGLASIAVILSAAVLPAQRPVSLSLAAGISSPNGDLDRAADVGWHALAAINVTSLMLPLGLRLEAAYNSFGTSGDPSADELRVLSLTGNLTYRLPMTNSPLSPYLIGGMGAYRTDCDSDAGCDGDVSFGWNAGLGTKLYLLGFRSFLEARYQSTTRGDVNVKYFPITFGITF
jgi:hypothetical protein